jgi:hypothetical protein
MEDFGDESVTTAELDLLVKRMREAQLDYDQKSLISKEAHFHLEGCKKKLLDLLTKAGKTKYDCEGVGKVTISERMSVSYPADLDERRKFVSYLQETFGEEGVMTYLTVNSKTLGTFYKEQFNNAKETGDASEFTLPGIPEPKASLTIGFRKA